MNRYIPVSPFRYIPASPSNRASTSPNKLVAASLIVAVNTIVFSFVYPLVAAT